MQAAGGEPTLGRDYVRMLAPSDMVARLLALHHSVDAYDEHGWTCLHWAALLGQVEHLAALLDSEAEPLLPTSKVLALPWCEWAVGTTAEQLARFPRGERGVNEEAPPQPQPGHIACRSMLRAAARGAFAARLACKRRGDVASASGDPAEAAAAYSEALGAVLQVGDSAVLRIEAPLAAAEAAIDAAAAAGRAAAAAAHQAVLAREAAEAQDMTRRQAAEAQQRGLQQEGLAALREAEASLATGRAKEAIDSVSQAMRITCAVGSVQYGPHLVSVLKQAGAMQAVAATAAEKAAGEEATRIKVPAPGSLFLFIPGAFQSSVFNYWNFSLSAARCARWSSGCARPRLRPQWRRPRSKRSGRKSDPCASRRPRSCGEHGEERREEEKTRARLLFGGVLLRHLVWLRKNLPRSFCHDRLVSYGASA